MNKLLYKVKVTGQKVLVTERLGALVAGMRGFTLQVFFTEEWNLLRKTAVFQAAGQTVSVADIAEEVPIPTEVLTTAGHQLKLGIFGEDGKGTMVVPTTWVTLDTILPGADPSAQDGYEPLPDLWQQIRYQIGDMKKLSTAEKGSLVAAINALAASKDPGDHRALKNRNEGDQHTMDAITGLREALGQRLLTSQLNEAINQALSAASQSGMFQGQPGEAGKPGANGYTPVKGTDYFTADEIAQVAAEAAKKVTGFLPAGGPIDFTDDGKGIAFGTTATEEGFTCAMPAFFTGPVSGVTPYGESAQHPGCFCRTVNGETEWLNPPMELGVEYRTTERYLGKPVYIIRLNPAALVNNGVSYIDGFSNKIDKIVDFSVMVKNSEGTTWYTNHPNLRVIVDTDPETAASRWAWVRLITTADLTAYTAEVTVKYTKT